jgi:predicted metal-dependent hydrolase
MDGERFKVRVRGWALRLRVSPTQIRVQRMTRKWASCSAPGRVTFSTGLLAQPRRFQDYVVVHELLHLRVPNHGRLFKSYLSAFVPGWGSIARGALSLDLPAENTTL